MITAVKRRGRFVVLLGADGCGKSSVLAGVADRLAPEFAGVELRHYRPQARWGAGTPVLRPHAAPTRSVFGSVLKLALDFVRFRTGYLAVQRHVRRGGLVLFDRYYHDLMADPRRYRYGGPAALIRWVGRLIPSPDLFVVLDAKSEVLQNRKQEMSFAESEAARSAYLALANSLPLARVIDAERALGNVIDDVAALVRAPAPQQWKRFPPGGGLLVPLASRRAAAAAFCAQAPCRPVARAVNRCAARYVSVLGGGWLPGRAEAWQAPMEAEAWLALLAALQQAAGFDALAIIERRQHHRAGFGLLLLRCGISSGFAKLRMHPAPGLAREADALQRLSAAGGSEFDNPGFLGHGQVNGWEWLLISPLAGPHRPARRPDLTAVSAKISRALGDAERAPDIPSHWQPMHGDLAPWNLRIGKARRLLLYDWERAGWGPPGADEVLFRSAAHAIGLSKQRSAALSERWPEACRYWLMRLVERTPVDRREIELLSAQFSLLDPTGEFVREARRAAAVKQSCGTPEHEL